MSQQTLKQLNIWIQKPPKSILWPNWVKHGKVLLYIHVGHVWKNNSNSSSVSIGHVKNSMYERITQFHDLSLVTHWLKSSMYKSPLVTHSLLENDFWTKNGFNKGKCVVYITWQNAYQHYTYLCALFCIILLVVISF